MRSRECTPILSGARGPRSAREGAQRPYRNGRPHAEAPACGQRHEQGDRRGEGRTGRRRRPHARFGRHDEESTSIQVSMAEWLRLQTRNLKVSGSSPGGPFCWQRPHDRQRPHSVCPLTAQRPQAGRPHARKSAVTAPGLAAAGTPEGRPIRPRGRPRTARCGRPCSPRPRGTAVGTPDLRTSGHGESRHPHGGPSDSNIHGRPHCPRPLCPWPLRCVRSQGQPTAPRADLEKDEAVNQRPPHSGPAHKRTGGQAGMGSGPMAGQADPCTGPRADEGEWARTESRECGRAVARKQPQCGHLPREKRRARTREADAGTPVRPWAPLAAPSRADATTRRLLLVKDPMLETYSADSANESTQE